MASAEGTISFWLEHAHLDWMTNSSGYNFGSVQGEGVEASAKKDGEGILSLHFQSSTGTFDFRHAVPTDNQRGVHVAVTWSPQEVKLYLNGRMVETVPVH